MPENKPKASMNDMVHVSTLSHINHPGPKKHMYINVHQRSVEASRLPVPASWNKSLLPANMPQFNSSPQQWSCCNVWWLGHPKQRKPSAELGWAHFPIAFAVNFRLAWGQNSTCWILEQILYIYMYGTNCRTAHYTTLTARTNHRMPPDQGQSWRVQLMTFP